MQEKKQQLIRNLKTLLRKHFGDNIKDVILFGSQANNTATEFSDYDYEMKHTLKGVEPIYKNALKYGFYA